MRSILFYFALVFALALAGWSKPKTVKLSRVYEGRDGLIHVVTQDGGDRAIPKADGQIGVTDPRLASDDRTAGWLIEQGNCCTSYPIPTRIGIYRDGKNILLEPGLMVYKWNFVDGGSHVVASIGTVHFMEVQDYVMFDTATGRKIREWNGPFDTNPPSWTDTVRGPQ